MDTNIITTNIPALIPTLRACDFYHITNCSYPEQQRFMAYDTVKLIEYAKNTYTVNEAMVLWYGLLRAVKCAEADLLASIIKQAKTLIHTRYPLHNGESNLFGAD